MKKLISIALTLVLTTMTFAAIPPLNTITNVQDGEVANPTAVGGINYVNYIDAEQIGNYNILDNEQTSTGAYTSLVGTQVGNGNQAVTTQDAVGAATIDFEQIGNNNTLNSDQTAGMAADLTSRQEGDLNNANITQTATTASAQANNFGSPFYSTPGYDDYGVEQIGFGNNLVVEQTAGNDANLTTKQWGTVNQANLTQKAGTTALGLIWQGFEGTGMGNVVFVEQNSTAGSATSGSWQYDGNFNNINVDQVADGDIWHVSIQDGSNNIAIIEQDNGEGIPSSGEAYALTIQEGDGNYLNADQEATTDNKLESEQYGNYNHATIGQKANNGDSYATNQQNGSYNILSLNQTATESAYARSQQSGDNNSLTVKQAGGYTTLISYQGMTGLDAWGTGSTPNYANFTQDGTCDAVITNIQK